MSRYRVSYYAHHFGTGHLRHAQKVASTQMFEFQVASTGPRNTSLLPGPLEYVQLTPDVGNHGPQGKCNQTITCITLRWVNSSNSVLAHSATLGDALIPT